MGTAKSHFGALSSIENTEIAFAVDLNKTDKRGLIPSVTKLLSFQEFLSQNLYYDLLILAVPTKSHLQILKQILDIHAPKQLIIEKPFTSDLTECKQLIDILEKKSISWQVNYFRSVLPNTLSALDYVLGLKQKPIGATLNGYGALLNTFSHFLHLLFLFTESENSFIQSCELESNTPKLRFATGLEVVLNNIGGQRQDLPILLISYETFLLEFADNGCNIQIRQKGDGRLIKSFQLPDWDRYQELATLEFLRRFEQGMNADRRKIEAVHEVVSAVNYLRG